MRRTLLLPLVILLVAACSKGQSSKEPVKEFRVAAASDLARAFVEVGKAYTAQSGVTPVFDFGSSGLLAKQIEQGAPFSLYAAANKNFADQVVNAKRCDGATQALYSRGRIVLWGKAGSPAKLEDLVDPKYKRIGVANPDHAPYGKAAIEALQKAGIYDQVKGRLVLAENVQAAQTYAKEGQVDVTFTALSLAIAYDSQGYLAIPPDLHAPLEQSMVVCGKGPAADAARAFAKFIVSDAGKVIMEKYGFSTTGVLPQK